MVKKSFLRAAAFLLLFAGLAAAASAQVTISGGFALSSMKAEVAGTSVGDSAIGMGGNVYIDYLLPVGVPLSLGFEIGADTAKVTYIGETLKGTAVPLLARVAYHFDLMPELDLYLVGKIGYVLGSGEVYGQKESGFNGVGFGFDLGAAYYFNPRFGLFAEAGFDRYNLSKDFSEYGESYTVKVPFTRFLTVGFSTKF